MNVTTCHCERRAAISFRGIVTVGLFLLTIVSTAAAKYSGGSGAAQDPYQIATAADLIALGETPEDYDKHFILTADIDLDPNLPGRKIFDKAVIAPDTDPAYGLQGTSFTGVFDGKGHTIMNLKVRGGNYLGLFGQARLGAKISNLGLELVDINGVGDYVGGLVGHIGSRSSSVAASYSTGVVSGERYIGGLVGGNFGSITTSLSACSVSGRVVGGGLVGENYGSIATSYSTGAISADWGGRPRRQELRHHHHKL
jgi:hypothetical protein